MEVVAVYVKKKSKSQFLGLLYFFASWLVMDAVLGILNHNRLPHFLPGSKT